MAGIGSEACTFVLQGNGLGIPNRETCFFCEPGMPLRNPWGGGGYRYDLFFTLCINYSIYIYGYIYIYTLYMYISIVGSTSPQILVPAVVY